MLTLITGTPGAGKTLYAVSELARKVPGSTIESNGEAVPRRLLSNVKDLLVEHERIDAEALNNWHEWAQPGDVILFDEVQEVWRPRALGKDVPPGIAKLETHRHMGVDIILVTQHPMLLDSNIRRLVNQHLHVRRIAKGYSMVYEWDHCSNIASLKTALQSRAWRYPKDVFALYKSAQLHTKPTVRIPRIAYVGVLALVAFVGVGKMMFDKLSARLDTQAIAQAPTPTPAPKPLPPSLPPPPIAGAPPSGSPPAAPADTEPVVAAAPVFLGCIASATDCRCYDDSGRLADITPQQCREGSTRVLSIIERGAPGAGLAAAFRPDTRGPVPPGHEPATGGSEAPAGGQVAVMPGAGYGLASRSAGRAL